MIRLIGEHGGRGAWSHRVRNDASGGHWLQDLVEVCRQRGDLAGRVQRHWDRIVTGGHSIKNVGEGRGHVQWHQNAVRDKLSKGRVGGGGEAWEVK